VTTGNLDVLILGCIVREADGASYMGSFVILEEYPHAGCSDVGSNPNLLKKKGCSDMGSWAISTRPVLK
jgi:hypothetical protein